MINAFDELSSHLLLSAVYGSCTQSRTSEHLAFVLGPTISIFRGRWDEDYSSDDGGEAEDDSTHEDHDAEEEDTGSITLRIAISGVGSLRNLNSAIYSCLC
jgi:hypothetical protein